MGTAPGRFSRPGQGETIKCSFRPSDAAAMVKSKAL